MTAVHEDGSGAVEVGELARKLEER